MAYTHILVAVAPTPESQKLLDKAVSIARPVNAKISLITLATDPEAYNQMVAPVLENLRELMQEETRHFLDNLVQHVDYPVHNTLIASGELSEHVKEFCHQQQVDLVICGNHNQRFFSRITCGAKAVAGKSSVDVLLVYLEE